VANPLRMPPRRVRVPRAGPRLRSRVGLFTAAGAFALVATVAGADALADRLSDRRISSATTTQLGGLTTQIREAGWTTMDAHSIDSNGGFPTPAQMMPGAPAGDEMRLGDRVTLTNTSTEAHRFNLSEEFALLLGVTTPVRSPHSDKFGQLNRLNPESAVDGVVYLDTIVPAPGDPPLVLRWTRGGDVAQLALPIGGVGVDHHGS
jgi:hypothetical protein